MRKLNLGGGRQVLQDRFRKWLTARCCTNSKVQLGRLLKFGLSKDLMRLASPLNSGYLTRGPAFKSRRLLVTSYLMKRWTNMRP
ncbi:hypothetical protein CEXT_312331 [Caerostris extrusa]|uniref:Uncharacterized protein n=1 Tax=Caerostris extrusa TaxID=172846 RepID=A0AAV4Y6V0_CAEEX|nr:hypothetical protein CEXT_312331 [Caerostris extrusa]